MPKFQIKVAKFTQFYAQNKNLRRRDTAAAEISANFLF